MKRKQPLIFEISKPGRKAVDLPACDLPLRKAEELIPAQFLRKNLLRCLKSANRIWFAIIRHCRTVISGWTLDFIRWVPAL